MMPVEQIEEIIVEKLCNLSQMQQEKVLRFIEYLEYTAVCNQPLQKQQMAQAARALLYEYQRDDELTAFAILDGEFLPDTF